jgi:abhydrolase domain-containing protein 17|uniref:alpha/beta hydrolase n=1 Tax=Cephaloticoccus sp. TaxID=1985742 RepID=UPI004049B444
MKFWLALWALSIVSYVLLTGWAYFFSDRLLFHPTHGPFHEPKGSIRIPREGGEELVALYLPNATAKYTIWFFHGNAENLGDIEPWLHELHDQGYAVFAVEYPGYGISPGQVSEAGIYMANMAALDYLKNQLGVSGDSIIAYGRSLGGGPAVELATRAPLAGLVLQSTFTSAYRVMTRWRLVPFDKFENILKLPRVKCPLLVMHGGDDRVVPFHHGESLYQTATGPKQNFWIKLAGHNDFLEWAGPEHWVVLRKFADSL